MGTNKTPDADALFAAADALLAEEPQLPPPAERARLREAAGITQTRLAAALQTTTQTVKNWENGRTSPQPPRLEAYRRILDGWAARHPAHPAAPAPGPQGFPLGRWAADQMHDAQTEAGPGKLAPERAAALAAAGQAEAAPEHPLRPAPRPATSRRPAAPKAADPRFRKGPLAVLDGEGTVHYTDGTRASAAPGTVVDLVEWALAAGLGAPRLHRSGRDSDPLVVLTPAAAVRLGLPERLEGHAQRRSLRLPEDHPIVRQITDAGWQLTRRGFGPWPRIYRAPQGGTRQCVQLAILSWDALDDRAWPGVAAMDPADIARALGTYADRVLTPRGSTAVSGLELMTALRPPTRAVRDKDTGAWVSGHNPGSLKHPMDPAPPEAVPEHPVAQGWTGGFLDEEVYQWVRPMDLLTGPETALSHALGLDLNVAFLAASARLPVGLSAPVHVHAPTFNPKIPGSWLADLSHVEVDPRLPSPFTPDGTRPTGPAWYRTHTLAYAQELGYEVRPLEAYLRYETGAYLDPWHDRLKTAYVETLADLGVTRDLDDAEFLAAMENHKQVDPALAAVLAAIKATVKGGIGKLRERPQGKEFRDGDRWPALERPTWRPDIRADIISKARVNMHRKLRRMAELTGLFPLAILSDCVVYPSPGASPLDLLPYAASGKPQGAFRLGPTPGLAKLEGVQPMAWAVDLMEQGYNPASHIKGDGHDAVLDAGE